MSRYEQLVRRRWELRAPAATSRIEDPQTFFSTLVVQVNDRVLQLADELAGPDPAGESYLEKVGRLNAARAQAEEIALSEVDPALEGTEDDASEVDLVTSVQSAIDSARD